ncbi:MAG TPA: 3-hydroxyacyl-CoA dehydrogenase NAD-binding domain-containing protein [Gemmataceae bacterium]|nr:3-hydroxyacyl-CoA dehydrogenase NAD-binding domain-containing protein [Gemmataceae bacterium]
MAFFQTDNLWVNQLDDGVAALILDMPDRSVNVLARRVLADLDAALDRVAGESSFRLLVIRSGKPGTFIAGADVHELLALGSPDEAGKLSEHGQRVFDKLAALPIPSAAIIGGACLGGGLELALACDYRVVLDGPRTQLGLPEVELGLLPAWGGTQRLPRVVGLERALQIILGGRRLDVASAVKWGLADEITSEKEEQPPVCLSHPIKRPLCGLPLRSWRQRLLESTGLGRWLIYRGTERLLRRRVPDDMPAPAEALQAVRVGLKESMTAGLAFERAAAARLAATSACGNLMRLFLQREEARKPWQGKPDPDSPPIRQVGVVGAGTMGAGIVQLALLRGCQVVIREPAESALGAAIMRILGLITKAVEVGLLTTAEVQKTLAAVHGTTAWKGFADLDLIIEAVVEDPKIKRSVFREMEKHSSRSTILASNTSSLRVAPLGEDLQYPDRVAGLHFFNPVHKMPLVEIVRTPATKQDVLDSLARWVVSLGKTPVFVKDSPGFLVNRILAPYFHEALLLVGEGMRVALVDEAMRRFGMLMGPLEVLDQVGLDVAADIAESLQPVFANRLAPTAALKQMKEQGWLGLKSGAGFYRYRRSRAREHREAMELLRGQQSEAASPDDLMAQARERLVGLMVNEAALCLGEGIAADAATIDLAMVLGSGWAPHRGGPLRYAEERSYGAVVESLAALARRLGPRFEPCAELRRLAGQSSG